jgi:pimeloyl-ACP methyl ester carboxylesterase
MKWEPGVRKAGKIALFTACGITGAVSLSTVIATWIMIKSGKKKDYDCIPRIIHGKLEPLTLKTSDGLQLHAWIQLSPNATSNNWALLLHGYRSDREVLQTRRRFFNRRGYHTLLLHFRGHGSSEPSRISYGYHERKDVRAAMEFIRSLHPGQPVRIGIDGVSMGAAAAAYAVAYENVNPDWVILESCYDNIKRALENRLALHVRSPFIPLIAWPLEFVASHLFRLRVEDLDAAKALEKMRCPVLVLAGDSEKVLKTEEVERLYRCIPEPKRLVFFPGAGHEDLLIHDPRRYIRAVTSFLRGCAQRQAAPGEAPPAAIAQTTRGKRLSVVACPQRNVPVYHT